MPKYGFFRYGTSVYGNLLRETSQSQLFAQAVDYGKVRVTIFAGPRVGSGYVLVRTKNGSAFDPSQGVVVSSGVINGQEFSVVDGETNFEDNVDANDVAVPTGSVFYTLFIIDESGNWIKDAATSLFSPQDQGTLVEFLKILPRVLTTSTGNPLDVPEMTTDLAKFLGGIAVTYDEFQTEIDAVLPLASRRSSVLRGLHESLARSVGMPVEFTIGVGASARLFRDAGFIYRQKGTLSGVRNYAEALTGWPSVVYDGPNMIRYLDDASFETGIGRWSATGATLTREAAGGTYTVPDIDYDYFLSPFANDGIGLVTLTATSATLQLPSLPAAGAATNFSTGRSMTARLKCIPVIAGDTYYLSSYFKPYALTGAATAGFAVQWLDQHGANLSTSTSSTQALGSLTDWTRVSRAFTAPAGASFAKLEVRFTGTVDDEIGIDSLQFATSDIHYHDPRTVTVVCAPTRVNLLTDGNFASGSEWTAVTGTATRTTSGPLFGTHCLSVVGSTAFNVVSEEVPARPGLVLNFSAYFLGDESTIKVEYLDADGDLIDVTDPDSDIPNRYEGLVTTTDTTEWQRFEVSALAPEGTESVRVRVSGTGSVKIDAVMLERSENARIYFDAITGDQAGEDVIVSTVNGHEYPMLYPSRLARLTRLRTTLPYYLPFGVSARTLLWDSDDPVVTNDLPYGT